MSKKRKTQDPAEIPVPDTNPEIKPLHTPDEPLRPEEEPETFPGPAPEIDPETPPDHPPQTK